MDADKIKDFLLYNFEKFIVAVVVALAGFLVYSGLGKEDITQSIQPDVLEKKASAVRLEVDEDHSDFVGERKPEFDIKTAMVIRNEPIDPAGHRQGTIWDDVDPAVSGKKRSDPLIAEAVSVQVKGVLVSMAARSADGSYPLKGYDAADPVEVEEAAPVRQPRRRGRGSDMEMMMEGYGDMGGYGEMGMSMDMGMDTSSMGMSSGAARRLPPDADDGMRPLPQKHIISRKEQLPVPTTGYFIAGSVAIPHKQIAEAYKAALADAADYNPRRDQPRYVDFQVQRADVSSKSIDQLQESDWVNRDDKKTTTIDAATWWCGFAPEFIPEEYRIPGVTMWIPPVLLDDYKKFSVHPLIPLVSQRQLEIKEATEEVAPEDSQALPDTGIFEEVIGGGGGGTMGSSGYESMGTDMDSYDGGYGMGGAYGGGASMMVEKNPVDHKLLRFYDWAIDPRPDPNSPKPGRQYVYRVRFAVEDPNHPELPELEPLGRHLNPQVYARTNALKATEAQNKERQFKFWSEWSQPSSPVMLPNSDRFYAGDVKPIKLRRGKVGNRDVMIETESPSAELVVSNFNPALGAYVPVLTEVTEGSVLSEKAETADVVDPISLEVKKVTDVEFSSAATVIDIDGGEPLSISESDEMRVPGMFLMMDGQGNLVVRDAVSERKTFRVKSFAKERGK
ncbi:hypothetical protein [Stieleria varia]|uniref:Uncharacterized protein n=1 Tax=Stieleria varia TaxID=2528005 RepID=A0A5C6ANM1_9BACT|nr:hypothetical protein [Stieleria varia]TWU01107.1 hypothetical protein Pla52n_44790 [Stieleria varia]